MGWFDGCFPRRRIFDSCDAKSYHAGSPRKPADFVRIAVLDDEKRKKLIQVHYKSGEKHIQAERYKEARDDFTRVIALNEKYSGAYMLRGVAKLKLLGASRNYQDVMKDLDAALEIEPKSAWTLGARGVVYQAMGQDKKALADFDQAIRIDRSLDWVEKARDEVARHRQQENSNDNITCEETIRQYREEFDLYKSELAKVQSDSKVVTEQWAKDKENIPNKYKKVFAESRKVLEEYEKLKKDLKRHNEASDKTVNDLLEEVEKVEEDIRGVKERHSTISSLRKECIKPVWELMRNISKKEKLKGLRAEMQKASVKPIDKVCAQWWKLYKTLYKERKNILDVYNYDIKRVLLSADKLLEKFLELQKLLDQQCSPESREIVNNLVKGIIQCFTEALGTHEAKAQTGYILQP